MNKLHLFKIVKFVIFTVVILWGQTLFSAVNAPEIRCISVNANGFVTVTWIPPSDPSNEFVEYALFSANSITGPYTSTPILGIGTSTFTDVTLANSSVQYYFIQSVYNDGSGLQNSNSSDTGQTMLPIFSAVTDSTCSITWNAIFTPNIPSSTGVYTIFRRIGTVGPYTSIATTNYGNETFNDSFKVCTDSIYYRIDIGDQLGCVSSSAILEDLFEDNTAPAPPVIDSITVNPVTKQVDLVWKPSTSPDTDGYLVIYYDKATAQYLPQSTIYGRFNTTYTETSPVIDPELDNQQFTVAAFDSCANPNPNTSAGAPDHRTIYLKITPNNCENTVTLDWTPYLAWLDLEGYEILVSVNNNPYQVAITLADTDSTYTHSKTSSLDVYCYKIRAFNTAKTRTSTSNEKCALSNSLIIPKKQYFKQITVEDNNSLHIISLTDTTLPVEKYALMRSLEPIYNFYEVDRISFKKQEIIELYDYEANVNETPYFYRIGIIDTCGLITYVSNPVSSMFLEGSMDDDSLNVKLNWNTYTGWDTVNSGVANFNIYQVLDGNRTLLKTVPKSVTDYKFTISSNIKDGANFCYEIEAREDSGNVFNQADSVLSNRVCFTRNLNVFVPNAFRPNGTENLVFKPVISFGNLSTYQMIIYDRWGQSVYETNNVEKGWDGVSTNGKTAPFGPYVYWIKISNFSGSTFTKKGTFVLLR